MVSKKLLYYDKEKFSINISTKLFEIISDLVSKKDKVNIALSGGSTPIPILEILATYSLAWEKINFFLVDERCVPTNSSQSNFRNINMVFFKKIESKAYSVIEGNEPFDVCAKAYQDLILQKVPVVNNGVPKFDLILLGMGEDGHTASLFPNTDGLNEMDKLVFVNNVPQLRSARITFSYDLILNAKQIILIVSGNKKKDIIEQSYAKTNLIDYPICRVLDEHQNITCFLSK